MVRKYRAHRKGDDRIRYEPNGNVDVLNLVMWNRRTQFGGVDLIPSSSRLEPANVTDNWQDADLHLSLAEGLPPIREQYDYILFDCPPSLSLVSYTALCACDDDPRHRAVCWRKKGLRS